MTSIKVYSKEQTDALLDGKQDALTAGTGISIASDTVSVDADTAPTSGSTNPVTSGGIKTALNGAIKYFRFKAVETDAPVASITVPASGVYTLDVTSQITTRIGSEYSLLGANGRRFLMVESCNNYEVIPLYSFYYANKYNILLKNATATAQSVTNLWVSAMAVKTYMITQ